MSILNILTVLYSVQSAERISSVFWMRLRKCLIK